METILSYLAVSACAMFTAWELARYFVEVRRPLFNFKPFNCRPCFTFWVTFAMCLICSALAPFGFVWCVLGSAVLSLINYLLIKSKTKIYE